MKTIIKLTEKYCAKLGVPAEILAELPEDQRCVKRMCVDSQASMDFSPETDEERWVKGIISTVDPDADGDVIPPDALSWERYQANPVVLFNHDLNSPIGFSDEVTVDAGGQVRARTRFGSTPEAQKVYQLMKDKVLRTFSVGFIPMEFKMRGQPGFQKALDDAMMRYPGRIDASKVGRILQKALVVEYSVVTIPANEHAVVTEMKSLVQPVPPSAIIPPVTPGLPAEKVEKPIEIKRVGTNVAIKRLGTVNDDALRAIYRDMWGV